MPNNKRKLIVDAPVEFQSFDVKCTWEAHDPDECDDAESDFEFDADCAKDVVTELQKKFGHAVDKDKIQAELEDAVDCDDADIHTFTWGEGDYTVTVQGVQEAEKESEDEEDLDEKDFVMQPGLKMPKTDDRALALDFIKEKGLTGEYFRWKKERKQ
mmetsp:Transcript_4283/g.10436  ORF Transcript_4283/g.10436 Transcript_4283/m.10436 type:complete len:157 (+) Transcript_4283:232-702(+)|eukprot:CAMPEP_0179003798 /NCGR_PEP_ID=MMETSP0795-20121207/12906_1 /TAXON_ID=88552 /ORGANISM="Amoebophrya sp., Strain Ameob2" /LENGTH=156 /DNA_ID=CAMNT_0020697903 /DNA_START=167 /DNA_END=637 /DNA_ORIENTATION=-